MNNHRIEHLIAIIDDCINRQVNQIIHHLSFQRLESAWRGLYMLIEAASNSQYIIIRFLNETYHELNKDLSQAVEFDQSQLFKKVYTAEFDHPGGQPFGLIIGNYYFSHKPQAGANDSVDMLNQISKIAAASFAPFIAGVNPNLFGLDSFTEIKIPFQLDDVFRLTEYRRWKQLRKEEDIRYLGLVLPSILMRVPYNSNGVKLQNRFFKEEIVTHSDYLWGNASFAYGCVVIRSFIETGWFSDIRGYNPSVNQGGAAMLIRDYFNTDQYGFMPKVSVEYAFTDRQEKILNDAGLLALRDHRMIEKAVFYSSQSLHEPSHNSTKAGEVNAMISSMLHYVLCVSRFVHYIKIIMRDKVGKFVQREECERYLLNWLKKYCAANRGILSESKARYPLSDANVTLQEQRNIPGQYYCTIHIKPHYQLDNAQSYLKLVTHVGN